ncbi:hypothetical protein WJX82_011021 [Trebouxia sp. C0006]
MGATVTSKARCSARQGQRPERGPSVPYCTSSCGSRDALIAQKRHRHKAPMAPAGWKPSKYRVIEPTLAEDLVKHYPEKYSLPSEDQLEGLGEEDYARIVFVNREEAWVYIEYVDDADKESTNGVHSW